MPTQMALQDRHQKIRRTGLTPLDLLLSIMRKRKPHWWWSKVSDDGVSTSMVQDTAAYNTHIFKFFDVIIIR